MQFFNSLGEQFIAHTGDLVTPKEKQLYNAIIKASNKLDQHNRPKIKRLN